MLIREALAFHLDGLREAGEAIPLPSALATPLTDCLPPSGGPSSWR